MCDRLKQRMRPLPVWKTSCSSSSSALEEEEEQDITCSSSITTTRESSSITFGCVQIREYNRQLGGVYSDLNCGLALGWEFQERPPIPLDEYHKNNKHQEKERTDSLSPSSNDQILKMAGFTKSFKVAALAGKKSHGNSNGCRRRHRRVCRTSASGNTEIPLEPATTKQRRKILKKFGYTSKEIDQAERERLEKLGICRATRLRLAIRERFQRISIRIGVGSSSW